MIEIEVYDATKNGSEGKQVHMHLEGKKLELIAELTLVVQKFVEENLSPAERFAFLMTLIQNT